MTDAEIRAHELELARASIRKLIRRGSLMALVNAGKLSPTAGDEIERGLMSAMRLLIELEHGHGTPEYIAAVEAERERFVLP